MTEIVLTTKRPNGQVRKEIVPVSEAQKFIYQSLLANQITLDEVAQVIGLYNHNQLNDDE